MKRHFYCLDKSSPYFQSLGIDDITKNRYSLLRAGIDHMGTDEPAVWAAVTGGPYKDCPTCTSDYTLNGKRITKQQYKKMLPLVNCMLTKKPWEGIEKKFVGTRQWILADYGGEEKCHLQNYLFAGSKDCKKAFDFWWWEQPAEWVRELF